MGSLNDKCEDLMQGLQGNSRVLHLPQAGVGRDPESFRQLGDLEGRSSHHLVSQRSGVRTMVHTVTPHLGLSEP